MHHLNKLIEFIASPPGLLLLACGVIWVFLAVQRPLARWAMFGAAMYAASLQKYFDPWLEIFWPPFSGPVEMAVNNGRPLSVMLLAALVVVAAVTRTSRVSIRVTPLLAPIHAIQALIFAKLLFAGGDLALTIQAGIIFILIGLFAATGLRQWSFQQQSMAPVAVALTTTGLLFVAVSELHLLINPGAVMRHGRLMGTTANPQHAAVLLAISLLGPVYLLASRRQLPQWVPFASIVLCAGIIHLLLLTGSRTGMAMSLIGALVFLRRRLSTAAIVGICAGTVLLVVLRDAFDSRPLDTRHNVERMVDMSDTRTHVWRAQWHTFIRHPLFGRPEIGDQFRSGENSWLGLMAATGVLGVGVLLWLLVRIAMNVRDLYRFIPLKYRLLDVDFCVAGLLAIFAGSFFEAYLLGVITMPVLFIAMLSAACESTIRDCKRHALVRPQGRLHVAPPEMSSETAGPAL